MGDDNTVDHVINLLQRNTVGQGLKKKFSYNNLRVNLVEVASLFHNGNREITENNILIFNGSSFWTSDINPWQNNFFNQTCLSLELNGLPITATVTCLVAL